MNQRACERGNPSVLMTWVGGYPAHYIRALHAAVFKSWGSAVRFVYIQPRGSAGSKLFERGSLTPTATVVEGGSWLELWQILNRHNSRSLLVVGLYPRALVAALAWSRLHSRTTFYWSDTNIHDVLRQSGVQRSIRLISQRFLLRHVDQFLYMGKTNKDFYTWLHRGRLGERKLRWFPCPVTVPPLFESRSGSGGETVRFLYLGRLSAEKGLNRLILAFQHIAGRYRSRLSLTIAGDGVEMGRLKRLVENEDLTGTIEFVGPVASDQTSELYRSHDVLVLPSNREAWGLVVNEALASGLPVIAPRWVGSVADLVQDKGTGWVLPDNSPRTIASAIVEAMDSLGSLAHLGDKGSHLVRTGGWTLDGSMGALDAVLTEIST